MPETDPVRLVVRGAAGRMGSAIARLAEADPRFVIAGGTGRHTEPEAERALIAGADVVIDVSSPEGVLLLLDRHADALVGRALVVGTTGLDDLLQARLRDLAAHAAVLVAANFSVGVNLLLALVRHAAAALPAATWDAEIVETHHRGKADAPSGTALAIADALARGRGGAGDRRDGRSGRPGPRRQGEVGMHAVRGGGVVGEHRALFLGARERLEISHSALDRDVFAEGALSAALWLAGRPAGFHGMDEVLGG